MWTWVKCQNRARRGQTRWQYYNYSTTVVVLWLWLFVDYNTKPKVQSCQYCHASAANFFQKRRWCFRLLLKKAFSKKVFVLQFHQAWNRGGLFVPLSQKSIKHLEAIRVVEAVLFRAVIKYESFDGSFTFFRPFVTSFFGLQNLFSWHSCKIFMLHLYLQQTIFGLLWCYRILDRNKTDAPKLWRDSWKCKDRLLRTLQTIWLKIVKVNELREREGLYAKTTFTAINFWCSAFCFFFRRKQWW